MLLERLAEARIKIGRRRRRGEIVVCDRYVYDSLVDLCVTLREPIDRILWAEGDWYERMLPAPDRVLLLDVDVDTALSRKEDIPSREYLETRCSFYRAMAKRMQWGIIDAARPAEDVAKQVDGEIEQLLGPGRGVE